MHPDQQMTKVTASKEGVKTKMTGSLSECFNVSEIGLVVCRQDFYVFLIKPYTNHLIHKVIIYTFLTGQHEDATYQIPSL